MFHYRSQYQSPQKQQQQERHSMKHEQSGPSQRQVAVTPAFVRGLMPRVKDEENECFEWNRRKFYETMEVEARNRHWEVTYAVPDMDEYDAHVLESVFLRLMRWLRDVRFDVRADSSGPRPGGCGSSAADATEECNVECRSPNDETVPGAPVLWTERRGSVQSR